jgi:hypothetical protein
LTGLRPVLAQGTGCRGNREGKRERRERRERREKGTSVRLIP